MTPILDMCSFREALQLKSEARTYRETAQAQGLSVGMMGKVSSRARHAGLDIAKVHELNEAELARLLYGERDAGATGGTRPEPDCAWVHRERRRPGVTPSRAAARDRGQPTSPFLARRSAGPPGAARAFASERNHIGHQH